MTAQDRELQRPNPFSTRFVRPGAIDYVFSSGESADDLLRRLAESGWRGQIVGPHGCGKSTLVASLLAVLERAGRTACVFALHDRERRMPGGWRKRLRTEDANLMVVDGYEQLGRFSRVVLNMYCRWASVGLLVTAHQDVGLPTLVQIAPDVNVAHAVVERLLACEPTSIGRDTVTKCFTAAKGNIRETLFALYDRFEQAGHLKKGISPIS